MDFYKIRIKDHLEDYWKHQFSEMTLLNLENGEVELMGSVESQAELFEILKKIRDLNLTLVFVQQLNLRPPAEKGSILE